MYHLTYCIQGYSINENIQHFFIFPLLLPLSVGQIPPTQMFLFNDSEQRQNHVFLGIEVYLGKKV